MRQNICARALLLFIGLITCAGSVHAQLLFENSDFEKGDLTNWKTEGTAFNSQPTKGDNAAARRPGLHARPQGDWWLGTYENYQGTEGQTPGRHQGNAPRGGLISTGFIITQPYITFLVGGGNTADTNVRLIVGGAVVREAAGARSDLMRRVSWDVKDLLNRKAMLYIIDQSDKPWGFINVDDFRFSDSPAEDDLLFPNSDFEKGDLTNWTAEGDAFNTQPVKGDSAAARDGGKKPAKPQGTWWIGTYEKFQGKAGQFAGIIQDDKPTGVLRSIPFKITGKVIAFRAGGGDNKEVAIRLLVDGKEVALTRGKREELLREHTWDVSQYAGKEAVIEIVDMAETHWGHINADDFRWAPVE